MAVIWRQEKISLRILLHTQLPFILMSNRVEDKTGGAINISEDIGKITGDILIPDDIDNLVDGLWFELKTVDLDGEENTYHLQLEVIEITRANDNSPSAY